MPSLTTVTMNTISVQDSILPWFLPEKNFLRICKNKLTDAELVKLDTFIQESDSLLLEHFHLTSDEADQVYQNCLDDGYLSYKKCMDYTASHKNQFS